ncbi:MAG: hypothetical protein ACRCV9_02125 [Burkholderiaceae bacterium]
MQHHSEIGATQALSPPVDRVATDASATTLDDAGCVAGVVDINWHLDRRVTPLLGQIAREGVEFKTVRDFSNSSWGFKDYSRPTGKACDQLRAIWHDYLERVYAQCESAFSDFLKLPDPERLALFAAGEHVEMPGHIDFHDAGGRAAYLAQCAKAMPGGFDRREAVT